MANTAQQDENALVERVFLRIGSAETDEQLQTAVGKFLAPLLLKLNSPDKSVRAKVMKLLAHIKTRLKSRSQVKLPVDALLTQFQDPEATPFITNFTILFIQLGFPRIEGEKQAELVPLLINCLEGRSCTNQDSILQLIIRALGHVKMPKTEDECKSRFPLRERPAVKQLLLDYFMDVLLLPYNSHMSAMQASSDMDVGTANVQPPSMPVPPGLSESAMKRLTATNPLTPEALEQAKLSVLKFLGSGVVEEKDAVCLYMVASSDTRHSVATSADLELKRISGSMDWNAKEILAKLFSIFLGTVIVKGQKSIKPEDRRSPASTRIRLKLFPVFLKARQACNQFPACLQVVFDCLFGANPNAKLRIMAVQFVQYITVSCEDAMIAMLDLVFLNGMLKLIDQAKEDDKLRSLAYIAVGKIGQRSPHRLAKDIQVVQTFFNAICQEDGETRLAVQEALSMMSTAFRRLDETNKQLMEALLLQNIDKEELQARVVCVQYAAAVFDSNHIPSRYVLMLGAGDIKEDVRSESVKALRGSQLQQTPSKPKEEQRLPDFVQMINYINAKAQQRRESKHRCVIGNTSLPFNPASYNEVVMYLRMCLSQSAGVPVEWQMNALPEQVPAIASVVRGHICTDQSENGPVQRYVQMLQELLVISPNDEAMYCLLEIVAMVPDLLASKFKDHTQWLKNLLGSSKESLKNYASQLCALVTFHTCQRDEMSSHLLDLQTLMDKKMQNPELVIGVILTLGYLLGLMQRADRKLSDFAMEIPQAVDADDESTKIVEKIATLLDDNKASTRAAACTALGEIGRSAALPIPDGELKPDTKMDECGEGGATVAEEDKESGKLCSKLSVVERLLAMIRTSNESNKTKEKAAMCLGEICIGEVEFPHRRKVIEDLFNVIQSRQVDLQMTIGEALVCVALGPKSPRARWHWTTTKEDHQANTKSLKDEVPWFLDQILSKYICHSNPHLRQGACIWLLTLVKQSGHHEAVQSKLLDIQRGFMRLLTENDEITQDLASKGLGLMMDICSTQQKDALVSELVDTLMTGKSAKNEVGADTTVFQSGTLGKTPDGGGMSTYKELCSIATDLNQPDLIYKFMHLANHNASWNARKGAAFGFSTIAAQAGEQLAPYLTQIVPRLYRYQFDPNPKIQQAMSGIWNALVQDNKKTVDTYLKEILNDLLKNLTSNQWRVRESSCLAVSDLLRGRILDDIIEDIPLLWEECLRVRDDIKESVRLAADSACKTLSRVSVKICDVTNGKVGEKAIRLVLPCLLQSSLQSSVSEVRAIGLSTILQISRNAGALMKPNIPVLVVALLEAVSGLEPEVMNYLSLHTGSQAVQEKLDSARIAASKMSPMMETVNRCVQYVDETVLPELVPRMVELIRGGIGLSTKVGCSSFIISLIHQCPQDLSPYAGKLMSAFLHGLTDRNTTVRKAYASALGHLVRVGKDSSVEKLVQRLKTWYLENEGNNSRHASCACLHAMSLHSPDCLRRHARLVMPLAFFAMHEERSEEEGKKKEDTSEWEDVWNEITPGTEAGIKLYLPEIVELSSSCLDSQAWSVKAQAGRSIATVAEKLGPQLVSPHLDKLLETLLAGLSGRTWTGKESLLKALGTTCLSCKQAILNASQTSDTLKIDQITSIVLRECNKEQPHYKMASFRCLGPILELYQEDKFQTVWDLTQPIVNSGMSPRSSEDDDSDLSQRQELLHCAFTLLGQAWPVSVQTQDAMMEKFSHLLCSSMSLSTWKIQVVLLTDIKKILERSQAFSVDGIRADSGNVTELINMYLTVSLPNLENSKFVSLRSESLAVLDLVLQRLKDSNGLRLVSDSLMGQIDQVLLTLAESGPWELRDNAKVLSQVVRDHLGKGDGQPQAMEH